MVDSLCRISWEGVEIDLNGACLFIDAETGVGPAALPLKTLSVRC